MAKSKPYNEKNDKSQDKKMTRGMDKDDKKTFEKMDKAHGAKKKPKTMNEDDVADLKIRKKIMHEKRESKGEERREHKSGRKKKEKK
jgi:RNA binding exosome subunit